MSSPRPVPRRARPSGHGVGRLWAEPEAATGYVDHIVGVLEGRDLTGMRVVVDCANGAASAVAPEVLARLGADVRAIARRARRLQHQRRLRVDASRVTRRRSRRHAVRTSGWPSTGTPTDSWPWTTPARWSTGDELLALFATDLAAGAGSPATPSW